MAKLIANVKVELDMNFDKESIKYKDSIEESLCGTYPLVKDEDDYYILLGEDPVGGFPTVNARVGFEMPNINYASGIRNVLVYEPGWPLKLSKEHTREYIPFARAVQNRPELGIHEGKVLYYKEP